MKKASAFDGGVAVGVFVAVAPVAIVLVVVIVAVEVQMAKIFSCPAELIRPHGGTRVGD